MTMGTHAWTLCAWTVYYCICLGRIGSHTHMYISLPDSPHRFSYELV